MRTTEDRIDFPTIDIDGNAAETGDAIHEEQSIELVAEFAEFLDRLQRTCGGLCLDDAEHLGSNFLQHLTNPVQIEYLAPGRFENSQLCADSTRHVDHPLTEVALVAKNEFIARFNQVDQTGLHSRHSCGTDRKGQLIFGLENLPEHLLSLGHDLEKLRIEVTQQGCRHHRQYARVNVTGSRPEKEPGGYIQLTGNRHL